MKSRFLRERGRDPLYRIWHRSGDAMLLYVHGGEGHAVARDRMLPLQAGTLCFVGGDCYHYTVPSDPAAYDRSKLSLDTPTLLALLALLPKKSPLRRLSDGTALTCAQMRDEERREVERLMAQAAIAEDGEEGEASRMAVFFSLLLYLDGKEGEPAALPPTPLQSAIEFIHAHVSEELTVDLICRTAHTSKFHFCRLFREAVGLTVMDYVLQTRLLHAKTLLRTTLLSVGEVSERCGFSSISYFSRVFREAEGLSPRAYRQKI